MIMIFFRDDKIKMTPWVVDPRSHLDYTGCFILNMPILRYTINIDNVYSILSFKLSILDAIDYIYIRLYTMFIII